MIPDLRPYIGVPFEDANCYELFRRMHRDLHDIDLPDQPYRSAAPRESAFNASLMTKEAVNWIPVPAGRERFGDAVLIYIHGWACHIGFVIGRGFMIHAQQKTFSLKASYRHDIEWRDRKKSFYRHPCLADADGQRLPASLPSGKIESAGASGDDGRGDFASRPAG